MAENVHQVVAKVMTEALDARIKQCTELEHELAKVAKQKDELLGILGRQNSAITKVLNEDMSQYAIRQLLGRSLSATMRDID